MHAPFPVGSIWGFLPDCTFKVIITMKTDNPFYFCRRFPEKRQSDMSVFLKIRAIKNLVYKIIVRSHGFHLL